MKKRYLIALSLITVLVMVAGAFSVMAQDDTTDPTTPQTFFGRGFGMRGGMMGWGGPAEGSMMSIVAEKLDMTIQELWAEFQAGKTLTDLVAEKGLEMQDIVDAVLSSHAEFLAAQVEAGNLTQAQADAMQAMMSANIEANLSAGGTGFGPGGCIGLGGSGFGGGRMGRGGRGNWQRGNVWQ